MASPSAVSWEDAATAATSDEDDVTVGTAPLWLLDTMATAAGT